MAVFNGNMPGIQTDNVTLNNAWRIAIGDLAGNVVWAKAGLLKAPAPVLFAGLFYDKPWTRDAAINAWNGASLLMPEVSGNTLRSVIERKGQALTIGGDYWDAIIWSTGAWRHYLYTGDREFLALALRVTIQALTRFEAEEFDPRIGLFRGPACYGDGVSAYPDAYADAGGSSSILKWPAHNPDKRSQPGYGLPMFSLSTNCLYYNAYRVLERMAGELGLPRDPRPRAQAERLKRAINRHFWNARRGGYQYLTGSLGSCDRQEGLGHAFALLFGVADCRQARQVLARQHIAPAGIPCVWPAFSRYTRRDRRSYGRHSGTVWPHIQGFWAQAMAEAGRPDLFGHELRQLARHIDRDSQCVEIYHPQTGKPYGGWQEDDGKGVVLWSACRRQTWSATALIRMVLLGLIGLRIGPRGMRFAPCLPVGIGKITLSGLRYRNMMLTVSVAGPGQKIKRASINGRTVRLPGLRAGETGSRDVEIHIA